MNTVFKKNIAKAAGLLSLILLSIFSLQADADTPASYPSSLAPVPTSFVAWPYKLPAKNTLAQPSVELNSNYLPFIYQNVYLAGYYAQQLFNLEKTNSGIDISPDLINYNAQTTAANNQLITIQNQNIATAAGNTQQTLQNFLSFNPSTTNFLNDLALIPGTDNAIPCNTSNCTNTKPLDSAFNADTLFGTLGYSALTQDKNGKSQPSSQAQDINHLILFLNNIIQPFANPGLSSDPDTLKNQLGLANVQQYLVQVRAIAALQSLALSNYNYIAQQREIIPGLGTAAGMKTIPPIPPAGQPPASPQPIPDASQLQLEKYLIDRRLNNPVWYSSMNSAPAIAVQRESLFVLAEMQRQLYETKLVNERILATLSALQMSLLQTNRSMMNTQASQVNSCLQNPQQCGPGG